jgi:hypothetical protein
VTSKERLGVTSKERLGVTTKERLGVTTKERLGMRIKKERLEVIRIEKEKSNNKIKKGGSLRVCSRT